MGTSATELSQTPTQKSEQRLAVRKRVSQPIPIELSPGKETWLHDMSEGGLSVSGSSRIELGATADVHFQFPETNSLIDATGVVAWTDQSGRAGVRFTRVEPDSAAALRRWLKTGALTPLGTSLAIGNADSELSSQISCLTEVADLQAAISTGQLDCAAALTLIVGRMAELTRASGAAIALSEDQFVVCRATFGNAPGVGVKLSPNSLSGGCFKDGTIVMLNDSEHDPRVDPELCRQLNFRSLLVSPITSGEKIVGIAEVLSPNARNFAGGDVLVLSFLTDLIASVVAPRIDVSVKQMEAPAMTTSSASPELYREEPQKISLEGEAAPLIGSVVPPVVLGSASVSVPVLPLEVPVQTIQSPTMAVKDVVPDKSEPRKSGVRTGPLALVVVVVLLAGALLSGYFFGRGVDASKASGSATPRSTPLPQQSSEVKPPAPSVVPASVTSDSKGVIRSAAKPLAMPSAHHTPAPSREDTTAPEELRVVPGGSIRSKSATETTPPEAPTVSDFTARTSETLPASVVEGRTALPEFKPPVLSEGASGGNLLKKILPKYPEMARRAGVTGDVVINATIGVDGSLHNIKVLSGSPLLREEAIVAAKQWRYDPYKLGGKPVETDTRITIRFHQ